MISKNIPRGVKFLGIALIITGLLFNKYSISWLFSYSSIPASKSLVILMLEFAAISIGFAAILYSKKISSFILKRRKEIILLAFTIIFVLVGLEILLRICLFSSFCNFRLVKEAQYYSNSQEDDFWYFYDKFNTRWRVGGKNYSAMNISQGFYDNWAFSLKPDEMIGYSRKENIDVPCHETSNLGTRALRNYTYEGQKILFYGDSGTESESCSNNTITARIERKTRIEALNYGVGGYGFDQTFLLFNRTHGKFRNPANVFLIGLYFDDLNRMLVKVRHSPKPYFTVENDELVLHNEHFNSSDLRSFFDEFRPKPRIYILDLIAGKLGINHMIEHFSFKSNQERKMKLTLLVLKEIKKIQLENRMKVYVVLYPTEKDTRNGYGDDKFMFGMMKEVGLGYIDGRECIIEYYKGREAPYEDLFNKVGGHLFPKGNDIFAECIVKKIIK